MINTALRQWRAGERSVGVWLSLGDLYSAEVLAGMGFDWLCVDLQHGFMDSADLGKILAATAASSTTPIVRVAGNQFDQIGKALDAGAHGVIVPMVNTAEEATRAAHACRYPPLGGRSNGPVRGVTDSGAYLRSAGSETACVVMIETAEGLKNVDAIAATVGVDALFIGPFDLCLAIGLEPGDFQSLRFENALKSVLEAGRLACKPSGIFGYSAEIAGGYLSDGFVFASVGTDAGFIRSGASAALATTRT